MPPRKICSDNAPLNQREWSVSTCYKRGIKAGFVAGLRKGQAEQPQAQTPAQATPEPATPTPSRRSIGISPVRLFEDFSPLLTSRSIQTTPVRLPETIPITPQMITPPFTPSPQGSPWQLPPLPPGTPVTPGNIPRTPPPTPPPPPPPAPVEPMNITAGTLKELLGRDAYKEFRDELLVYRQEKGITSKPQESYNKLGIEDYRILAQKILSTVQNLSDVNTRMLNDIVNDRRIQGNKVLTKTMIDSVITNIYRTRGGASDLQKGLASEYRTLLYGVDDELRQQMNYIVHSGDTDFNNYDRSLVRNGIRVARDFSNTYDRLAATQLTNAYQTLIKNAPVVATKLPSSIPFVRIKEPNTGIIFDIVKPIAPIVSSGFIYNRS